MALGLGGLVTGRPDAGVDIDLAVPGRPIGPWSRRTGAPEASATGRDRDPSLLTVCSRAHPTLAETARDS
jgi:hypothetical protein